MSKASQIRQKAQELLGKGQIDKAVQEYRRLISIESKNPNLYNELGDIFLRASDREQAVQSYEKASVIYEKVALYNNAVAVCKKILRVNPDKIETILKLAELRAKQKLENEAVCFFAQYVEQVLANPEALLQRSRKDVDRMLELMPASGAILERAAEIYEQLGAKIKTAELCMKLAASAREKGDARKHAHYQRKVEELKANLDPDEAAQMQELEAACRAEREATEAAESPEEKRFDTAAEEASPEIPDETAEPVAPAEPAAEGPSAESEEDGRAPEPDEADTGYREAVEEAEMVAAMSQGREEYRNVRAPSEPGAAPAPPARQASFPQEASGRERSAFDAPSPGACGGEEEHAGRFVEEITSDVEKDDLRSHYDLGMAYLEMGLYTESIRDFQIASRCPELQLSSMEMIGYCFLKSNQARLAVKQLQRALDIAKAARADNLGIHYNLGLAYESLGETQHAREHFEEVYIVDMTFREVAEKMKKLSAVS